MIAGVILNNSSHNVDREFDYEIPAKFIGEVSVGTRVLVPFGRGNAAAEGIVVALREESEYPKLKSISSVVDKEPICTQTQLDMCEWIKNRYFCSFYQAFKLFLPPQPGHRVQEWVELSQPGGAEFYEKGSSERSVLEFLADSGGCAEMNEIYEALGYSGLRSLIGRLAEAGAVTVSGEASGGVREKCVRMASLAMPTSEAADIIDTLSGNRVRARVQAKMLSLLCDNGSLSTADLVSLSNGNYAAVNSLVKKGFIKIETVSVAREVYDESQILKTDAYEPTEEQRPIIEYLQNGIGSGKCEKILLRGVTGSGKTEIFMQAISKCIERGKKAIMLVPEISLTPQTVNRFVGRFGSSVAVIHSGLSAGERYDQWRKIRAGEVDVVVGARSAIFAPFENIGIIILDEEHENSYKSEITPRYHARDVAERLAEESGAVLLLASATPSVSSYYKAQSGRYKLFEMHKRYNENEMPDVKILDMRGELFENKNSSPISLYLQNEIGKNLERGEKTILFLNRRGHSTFVSCRKCGYVMQCENCDIALTYHIKVNRLVCHYCGASHPNVDVCPECGSKYIRFFGTGTEKIETELKRLFPSARILRMDTDTTAGKGGHERILSRFANGEADILLGTQMVAKGLDFPDVTLVGVLAADTALNIDDFRAAERSFCLFTQVCGRAGRGGIKGRAVIQTYQPQNSTLAFAKEHNYGGFYKNEIEFRKMLKYPPFCDIISIMITGEDESEVRECIWSAKRTVDSFGTGDGHIIGVLGPAPAPIAKIKNKFRYRIMIKAAYADDVRDMLLTIQARHREIRSKSELSIDINPINMY